uniref:Uncharacterized protein n=1 Tax=Anguilla anguilla TaxID=7936 RepID=A0A0E9PVL4_ANGAN
MLDLKSLLLVKFLFSTIYLLCANYFLFACASFKRKCKCCFCA